MRRSKRLSIPAFIKLNSLALQFLLASLIVLMISVLGLGWWIGQQIETGVINRTAGETALFVDSFIDPPLQELGQGEPLTPKHTELLNQLIKETPLGQHIVAFKVWDTQGKILYSTNPALIGQVFPLKEELLIAFNGNVVSHISKLEDAENILERGRWKQLLETYSPVTKTGGTQIIAVVEFYQTVDTLRTETEKAQISSWLLLTGATLVIYLFLSIFVNRASNTINRQQAELSAQVENLTKLLVQNEELTERVSLAASNTTTLNERFLRRISAELHDGPVQDLGYALLRLDGVIEFMEQFKLLLINGRTSKEELEMIEASLQHAIGEIRTISAGMGLPELDQMTLTHIIERVVAAHNRRTNTKVDLKIVDLPEQASSPTKIALYRLIQEALNNSYRHGKGTGQQVEVSCFEDELSIEISDLGPGFDVIEKIDQDIHLGILGMRERVESLGGSFQVESKLGQGTKISANIRLHIPEGHNE